MTTHISLELTRGEESVQLVPRETSGGSGPELSNALPQALGSASAGTGPKAAREDHVHALPTASAVGAVATSVLTTKGDMFVRTDGAIVRLPVGTGVLLADPTQAAGMRWGVVPISLGGTGSTTRPYPDLTTQGEDIVGKNFTSSPTVPTADSASEAANLGNVTTAVVTHVTEYHRFDFRRYAPANAATNGADCTAALGSALTDLAATITQGMKAQASGSGAYQRGTALNGGAYDILVDGGMYVVGNIPNDINAHRAVFRANTWGSGFIRKAGTSGTWFENQRDGTKHVSFVQFHNMTIHGNWENNPSAGNAIVFHGDPSFTYTDPLDEDYDIHGGVFNCQIIEVNGDAIRCEGSGGVKLINNRIRSVNGIGIYMDWDNHAEGNDIGWTGKQAVVMAGDSCGLHGGKYWYTGRAASDGTNGQGILCTADSGIISGVRTQDTRAQGLLLDGAHNITVAGANIDSASTASAGGFAGLDVFSSTYCAIMPFNTENRFNGPDTLLDALNINSASQNCDIVGIAGKSPWGVVNSLKSGSSKHSSTYVRINGTVL
jgi:hypothetical protein